MKGTYLGELEELVLLTVAVLNGEAYGVSIADTIEAESQRKVTISSMHNVLHRLEKKQFVKSRMGGATAERGGRKKRLFEITATGYEALNESKKLRNGLWQQMPNLGFE